MREGRGPAGDAQPTVPGASAARSTTGILATQLLLVPINLVVSLLVARILGPHDRGLYAFLLIVGALLLPVASFGFGSGIVYHIGKAPLRTPDIVLGCMVVGFLQGAVAAGAFFGLWRLGVLGESGSALGLVHVVPVLAATPFQGMCENAKRILIANGWFAQVNLLSLAEALSGPALLALFVIVLRLELTGAVAAIVAGRILLTTAMVGMVVKRARPRLVLAWSFVRDAAGYGVRVWWAVIASEGSRRLDWLLLGAFASPADLGAYAIASRIAELVWMLPDAAAGPLFNRLTRSASDDARWELTARVHRSIAVVCLAGAVVLGITGFWFVPWLLGASYAKTPMLMAILLPGVIALLPGKLLTKYFGSSGQPGLIGRMGVITAAVAAVAYFVAIPTGGAVGAAIASGVAYATTSIACIWYFRQLTGKSVAPMFRFQRDDVTWLRLQVASIRGAR